MPAKQVAEKARLCDDSRQGTSSVVPKSALIFFLRADFSPRATDAFEFFSSL